MRQIHRFLLLLLVLLGLGAGQATAQTADPWADWQSADSAHFRVHYRLEQRHQAEQVAQAAERAYRRISPALHWQPASRIELVVFSEFDLANGYSTPQPYNLVGAFLAPPQEGELLDNSPWLDLLLTHELVHTIHLDKVRGAPKVLRNIFGRAPWFFPNLFEPGWALEGLAVYHEGAQDGGPAAAAALGRGRLYGPTFEAWLRAEQAHGFMKLAELNADGRALPLSKAYLYGGYFFDFVARRYGAPAVGDLVENYSGNIVPRLHTNPREITGKTMDVLWDEFLADLDARVTERAAVLRRQPEAIGAALTEAQFDIASVAALPDGRTLAVLDDGVGATELVQFDRSGQRRVLTELLGGARLDVSAGGTLLVTQADLCDTHYLSEDVYRWNGTSLDRLTRCAHLRRATTVGARILALQLDAGHTRLVSLASDGSGLRPLYTPPDGTDLLDLSASPDGRHVQLISRVAGDWRLIELDIERPEAPPQLLLAGNTPMHTLRAGPAGLEFISARDGVSNVWRLHDGQLTRLTHSHTGVTAHGGSQADGSLTVAVVVSQGLRLHRQNSTTAQQTITLDAGRTLRVSGGGSSSVPPADPAPRTPANTRLAPPQPPTDPALGVGSRYLALQSMYPRSWWPLVTADHGLTAYGASTYGADALRIHQYTAALQVETHQHEAIGSLEYLWLGSQMLALQRSIKATRWSGSGSNQTTLGFDRHTQAQWLSTLPWVSLQRKVVLGVGAAIDRVEQIQADAGTSRTSRNDRLAALLLDIDTRESNWWSEGANRGQRSTLLFETYKPFLSDAERAAGTGFDGSLLRADLRGYLGLGRSVIALRHTEARTQGRTRPFQLGGATDPQLQLGSVLNSRDIALRGYRGNEAALQGQNARVSSVEWRAPLADIDRHAMVPPVGINRLSGALFFDIGGAWNPGSTSRPAHYHRGVGLELLGEVKLLYTLGLQLRLGLAHGLDAPNDTLGYLSIGRAF
ncbi:MAG: hypothetical protein RLY71_2675 [Pseudomonadota bacterium]|jgi:hypothetical protein